MNRDLFLRLYGVPILEMNALQRKALLNGKMVNAEGVPAESWSVCEIGLLFWGDKGGQVVPELTPTPRGPWKRGGVTLIFNGESDVADTPPGLNPGEWLALFDERGRSLGEYWLPEGCKLDFD